MQSDPGVARTTGATVLGRALEMKGGEVPPEGARLDLDLGIRDEDKKRILDLLTRQQAGEITVDEAEELRSYIPKADNVLSVLKAKALVALKKAGLEP